MVCVVVNKGHEKNNLAAFFIVKVLSAPFQPSQTTAWPFFPAKTHQGRKASMKRETLV
jgi:hypothetical protein